MPNFAVRVYCLVFSCCFALFLASCATLPSGVPVSEMEQVSIKQDFSELLDRQKGCVDQIDADISVRFESLLYTGKIDGYLQAMPPAYLRFDGLNPFGLTEIVLTTDGVGFSLLAVREEKSYSGPVTAEKFQKYATQAFSENFLFLLNGLVPTHEEFVISRVLGEEKGDGYWLDLDYPERDAGIKLRFHPENELIDTIIVIPKQDNDVTVLTYQYPSLRKGNCPEPQSIQIDSNSSGVMTINFSKRYPLTTLKKGNFQVAIPSNYTKVVFQ